MQFSLEKRLEKKKEFIQPIISGSGLTCLKVLIMQQRKNQLR